MTATALRLTTLLLICAAALLTPACSNRSNIVPFDLEMEARQHRPSTIQQPTNHYQILIETYARCHGRYSPEEQKKRATDAARRIMEHPQNAAVIRHQIRAECFATPVPDPATPTQKHTP